MGRFSHQRPAPAFIRRPAPARRATPRVWFHLAEHLLRVFMGAELAELGCVKLSTVSLAWKSSRLRKRFMKQVPGSVHQRFHPLG